jgi:acyl-CoA reductase-like NAD-dependent aldehyde dehydrogenase
MKKVQLFINGEFCDSSENYTTKNINPATGEIISTVEIPTSKDIDYAVDSAYRAFYSPEWRNKTKNERAEILLKISDLIKARKDELIDWEIKDSGSTLKKAKADIHNTASYFKVLSKQLSNFQFEFLDENASTSGFSKNYKIYEPIGVCAQIIPWNFPLVMAAWKIGPVLATGCTTILKSALETPMTASILAEIIKTAGVPKGVVNIITGGEVEGKYLINHPKINKIAFTGSTEVGRKIMNSAASSIKKLSLELGGKSANIILEDADLDVAVDGSLYAFLYHSGQACDSGTRLLIQKSIYPQFIEKLKSRMEQIKVGIPEDVNSGYGPVINQKQFDRIINYIQITKNEGAKLVYGGERLIGGAYDKGYYIKPTAFEITPQNTIWKEEIFGPVVGITSFQSIEEAIKLANDSEFGLAAAVWSRDHDKAKKIAHQLEAGTVWINEYHLLNPGMPFGGYKQSGLGREMGPEGIRSYLEVKHVWESDCDERAKKPWYDVLF